MKNTVVNGKNLSNMTLGTVQLGMNYGIANQGGQPDTEKSHSMLSTAIENGVLSLDTARAYGTSEDVLGGFLKKCNKKDEIFITSKVKLSLEDNCNSKIVEKAMFESVETSLSKLGVNKLDCLLLHSAGEMTKYGDIVPETLERMIKEGYIDMAGASVYEPCELDTMLKYDVYTATQVPMSIFDQKLITKGYIKKLESRDIKVFVRSVFLQGLFFLNPDTIDDPLLKEYAAPYIRKLLEFCSEEGMTVAEFAISFIRDIKGVTSLVLGADTPEQVMQNIGYMNAPSLSESVREKAYETFKDVNLEKIMEVLRRPKA